MLIYAIECGSGKTVIKEICSKGTAESYENAINTHICVCRSCGDADKIANLLNNALYDNAEPVEFVCAKIPDEYKNMVESVRNTGNSGIEKILGTPLTAEILENIDIHIFSAIADICNLDLI